MALGKTPTTPDLFLRSDSFCDGRLGPTSIYRLLAAHGQQLFGDAMFMDLFDDIGRRSVAPQIVATVMVLQRLEGLSDREAVDRFAFDLRWKYAAGNLPMDFPGFVHTVLVDMRARLARSERPNRIFEAVLAVAKEAGMVGRRRVLDSTPLYDAVATQDTVTMIRSAIRQVLKVVSKDVESEIRTQLTRDDDYVSAGKPTCAWDDAEARAHLVNALVCDANQTLQVVQSHKASPSAELVAASTLLATVVGQDIETSEGRFTIRQGVAEDRIISTVDPETRHGRKSSARGFDGYKGHISIDPDSEIITLTTVSAGNVGDGAAAEPLLQEALESSLTSADDNAPQQQREVFGDCAYGTAEIVEKIEAAGALPMVRMQPPVGRDGQFTKADFKIDLADNTVCCPAGQLVQIRRTKSGEFAEVKFLSACATCLLALKCTTAKLGRTIHLHPREQTLQRHRTAQTSEWLDYYRANRPKVERKIGHLMRRKHGGRLCRVRGRQRVAADFALLAASVNLNRLASKGLAISQLGWVIS
jgi:hypothetical protein